VGVEEREREEEEGIGGGGEEEEEEEEERPPVCYFTPKRDKYLSFKFNSSKSFQKSLWGMLIAPQPSCIPAHSFVIKMQTKTNFA
jgi:hypothetical protein